MNPEPELYVADVVGAAGGRVVSRIRLQKIAYLLDQLGANSGFRYAYHHYGPYSRELDSAILDAEAFGFVSETYAHRQSDGARYSVFALKGNAKSSGLLEHDHLRQLAKRLASQPVTILELAATAHWLDQIEKVENWRLEIQRRKGTKTGGGRLEMAIKLLTEIGLPPAFTTKQAATSS